MVSRVSQPGVLRWQSVGNRTMDNFDILAMRTADSSVLGMRIVNYDKDLSRSVSVVLPVGLQCKNVSVLSLHAPPGQAPSAINPPSNMTKVAPYERNMHE